MSEREARLVEVLSPWAGLWLALALGGLGGSVLVSPLWSDPLLPLWTRPILFAVELCWMTLILALLGVLSAPLRWLPRTLRLPLGFLLLFTGALFYAASWQSYAVLGAYLDSFALQMVVNDGPQLIQHLIHTVPVRLASATLAAVAGAVLLGYLARRLRHLPFAMRRRLTQLGAVLVVVSTAVAVPGSLVMRNSQAQVVDERRITYTLAEYGERVSKDQAGPFGHLKHDLVAALRSRENFSSENLRIERKPLLALEEYTRGVDRTRFVARNVIVILVESLRRDQLPIYGGPRNVMPTVQSIAEQSQVYSRAYAQASHSNYADLAPLSSHYPLRSARTHFYPRDPSYPRVLIYDVLHALGYKTAIFSSQNENWGGMYNYLDTGNLDKIVHADMYSGALRQERHGEGKRRFHDWMLKAGRSGKIDDADTIGEALKWLHGLPPEQPFFMYVNLQNSHVPYVVPADFERRFVNADEGVLRRLRSGQVVGMPVRLILDAYADSLFYIDTQIAALVGHLRASGRWDNTVLVLSADTATRFDGSLLGNGGELFEQVVHVPLVVRAPGVPARIDTRYVQHIDVPPTLLDLLGLPPHPSFQGRSLLRDERDSTVFLVAQTPLAQQYAVIRDGWRLLYDERLNKNILSRVEPNETAQVPAGLADSLVEQLHTWIGLQLEYYGNPHIHRRFYPPVIADPS